MFNKIYQGDCLELMKELPDGSIDLTVTSPPYDNLRTYNGFSWDFENIAKELFRVTKDGGIVVWIVNDATINGDETGTSFKQALYFKEIGFRLHDTMIYAKTGFPYPETNRYYSQFEFMFVLSKGKPKTANLIADAKRTCAGRKITGSERRRNGELTIKNGAKVERTTKDFGVRGNIWHYSTGWGHSAKEKYVFEHPAIFPEALAHDHIITWSNENDVVLDPFLGSGTTAKMAINTNRKFIGYEIDKKYFEIAQKRIAEALQKKSEGLFNLEEVTA